jgi:DNA (cytosine-5)-methyltransferase 1
MESEITVLDLFSGIGGFSLGLERAGPFRTVAFCEQEPFPQAVLRKHWPGVPIYDDVRTIPTDELGRIDLVCGGFPCQPWSVAGQRQGTEDDRDLWPTMAALVEELRPKWVIGENVRGFVNEEMGLQRSLSDLESIGYQAVPFIIPACAVDAPHRRDRVWIIAHADKDSEPDGTVNETARYGELVENARRKHGQSRAEVAGNVRGMLTHGRSRNHAQRSGADVADADRERGRQQARCNPCWATTQT